MISTIGAKVIHRGLRGGNDDRSSPSVNNFGRTISAWSLLPLSYAPGHSKAPASWTHSKRFATSWYSKEEDCLASEGGRKTSIAVKGAGEIWVKDVKVIKSPLV